MSGIADFSIAMICSNVSLIFAQSVSRRLNVVDAYRLMKTNGPRGKSEADVVLAKGLFMSPDIVAVDTAATKFFNQVEKMPLEVVGHLAKGEELKIGTMDINRLKVKRIKI